MSNNSLIPPLFPASGQQGPQPPRSDFYSNTTPPTPPGFRRLLYQFGTAVDPAELELARPPMTPLGPAKSPEQREQDFVTAFRLASQQDARLRSEIRKIGHKLEDYGVSEAAIRDNLPTYRRIFQSLQVDRERLRKTAPSTYDALTNPRFANVAWDITPELTTVEQLFNDAKKGWLLNKLGKEAAGMALSDLSPEQWEQIAKLQNELRELEGADIAFLSPALTLSGQFVEGAVSALPYGAAGAGAGAAAGAFALGAGAIPGAAIGFKAGMTTGYLANSFMVNSGLSAIDMHDRHYDSRAIRSSMIAVGLGNMALDYIGAKAVAGLASKTPIGEWVRKTTSRNPLDKVRITDTAKDIGKAVGSAVLTETATETGQTINEMVFEEIARQGGVSTSGMENARMIAEALGAGLGLRDAGTVVGLDGQTYQSRISEGQFGSEVWETIKEVSQGMTVIGGVGGVYRAAAMRSLEKKEVTRTQDILTKIQEAPAELADRDPDSFRQWMQEVARDSGAENVKIPLYKLREKLRAAGIGEDEARDIMPEMEQAEELEQLLGDTVDVVVGIDRIKTEVVPRKGLFDAIKPAFRMGDDRMSFEEFQEREEAVERARQETRRAAGATEAAEGFGDPVEAEEAAVEQALEEHNREADQVGKVRRALVGMYRDAKVTGSEASAAIEMQMGMMRAAYKNFNVQEGLPFDQWFDNLGLEIVRNLDGRVQPAADARAQNLRSGRRPQELLGFVNAQGGFTLDQWRKMGVDIEARSGQLRQRRLVRREGGSNIEAAAREAQAAGFLDGYNVETEGLETAFLNAVNDALDGSMVTAEGFTGERMDRMEREAGERSRPQRPEDEDPDAFDDPDAILFSEDFDQPADADYDPSTYRPEVVSWAAQTFGDRVAPNGRPVADNFVAWFGDSELVDAQGRPQTWFKSMSDTTPHMSRMDFRGPQLTFAAPTREAAKIFARTGLFATEVQEVYLSARNVFDFRNPEHAKRLHQAIAEDPRQLAEWADDYSFEFNEPPEDALLEFSAGLEDGAYQTLEMPTATAAIESMGFDAFYVSEAEAETDQFGVNIALTRPQQLKSVNNVGDFSSSPVILEQGDFGQASDAAYDEGSYRPEVVGWAKEKFGDRVAPNGRPIYQNFVAWLGDSELVDEQGQPQVWFKAMTGDVPNLMMSSGRELDVGSQGMTFAAPTERAVEEFAQVGGRGFREVYVSAQNVFDYRKPEHVQAALETLRSPDTKTVVNYYMDPDTGTSSGETFMEVLKDELIRTNDISDIRELEGMYDLDSGLSDDDLALSLVEEFIADGYYQTLELATVSMSIRRAGFDAFYVTEAGFEPPGGPNIALFRGDQLKSADNIGDFRTLGEGETTLAVGRQQPTVSILEQTDDIRRGSETLEKYGLEPGGKYKVREVAAALEARQRELYGEIGREQRDEETRENIARWMVAEVLFEFENPEDSGVGWYSTKFQKALDTAGDMFAELKTDKTARNTFTALIAITSDGQTPQGNYDQAADIYGRYRETGELTVERGTARQASVDTNLKVLADLFDRLGVEGAHEFLMQEMPITELRKLAAEQGLEFKSAYQVHIKMPLAAVMFGPKLGAFYANLMGAYGYLTMDRWWSRTFNRYRGTLVQAPTQQGLKRFKRMLRKPRMSDDEAIAATVQYRKSYEAKGFKRGTKIEKAANTIYKMAFENLEDTPFGAQDRTFMLDATGQAKDILRGEHGLDLSIADIQAILWYYEKKLYGELGSRQSAKISYEDAARIHAERRQDDVRGRPDGEDRPSAGLSAEELGGQPYGGVARLSARPGRVAAPEGTTSATPVEGARRVLYSEEVSEPLVSGLLQELQGVDIKQGSPQTWMQSVQAMINAGKVKKEEVTATGLMDLLAARDGEGVVLTRDDVVKMARDNRVQVEIHTLDPENVEDEIVYALSRDPDAVDDMRSLQIEFVNDEFRGEEHARELRIVEEQTPEEVVLRHLAEVGDDAVNYDPGAATSSLAEYHSQAEALADAQRYHSNPTYNLRSSSGENLPEPRTLLASLPEGSRPEHKRFRDTHYDGAEDTLVWNRMNTTQNAAGQLVSLVQENQSDYGQQLRNAISKGFGPLDSDLSAQEAQAAIKQHSLQGNTATPLHFSAPFVERTDSWTMLGIKSALLDAVKRGHQQLQFVSGDVIRDRYDLGSPAAQLRVVSKALGEDVAQVQFEGINNEHLMVADVELSTGKIVSAGTAYYEGRTLAEVAGQRVQDFVQQHLGVTRSKSRLPIHLIDLDRRLAGLAQFGVHDAVRHLHEEAQKEPRPRVNALRAYEKVRRLFMRTYFSSLQHLRSAVVEATEGTVIAADVMDILSDEVQSALDKVAADPDKFRNAKSGQSAEEFAELLQKPAVKLLDVRNAEDIQALHSASATTTIDGGAVYIGGEWALIHYDSRVPRLMKKLAKQLGGEFIEANSSDERATLSLMSHTTGRRAEDFNFNTIVITPELRQSVEQGGVQLFSEEDVSDGGRSERVQRARFIREQVGGRMRRVIELLRDANPSSIYHELAHAFFDYQLAELEQQLTDPDGASSDLLQETMLAFFESMEVGPENGTIQERLDAWNGLTEKEQEPFHEAIARNFEVYLGEGQAPTRRQKRLFQRVRAFMVQVYEDVALRVNDIYRKLYNRDLFKVQGDVKQAFDRMVAAQEDIDKELERADVREESLSPELYADDRDEPERPAPGVVDDEDMRAEARDDAIDELTRELLADAQLLESLKGKATSEAESDARRARRQIKARAEQELQSRRVHRLRNFLRSGKLIAENGTVLETRDDNTRLNTEQVRRLVPGIKLNDLGGALTSPQGMDVQTVTDLFGYESSSQMIAELRDSMTYREEVQAVVDREMLEKYGNLATPEAVQRSIKKAVYNEARQRALLREIEQITGVALPVDVTLQAARDVAKQRVSQLTLREMRPYQFQNDAMRSRREAFRQLRLGNRPRASQAFRAELLYNAMVREAAVQRKEAESRIRRMEQNFAFGRDAAKAKTRDMRFIAFGRVMLSAIGLGGSVDRSMDQVAQIEQYDPEFYQANQGLITAITKMATNNVLDLRGSTLQEALDMIESVWDRSYTSRQITVAGRRMDRDQLAASLATRLMDLKKVDPDLFAGQLDAQTAQAWSRSQKWAQMKRFEQAMMVLDGGEEGGLFARSFYEPLREALDRSDVELARHYERLQGLMQAVNQLEQDAPQEIVAPELGGYTFGLSRRGDNGAIHEIVTMVANLGTISNRDRLMSGFAWSQKDESGHYGIQPVVKFINRLLQEGVITRDVIDLAQGMMDTFELIKPDFQKALFEVEGRYVKEIDAEPFQVLVDGEVVSMAGGYVPMRYDQDQSQTDRRAADEARARAQTLNLSSSATKERQQNPEEKINLRLDTLMGTFQEHVRYAYVVPVVKQVRDLLRASNVQDMFQRDRRVSLGQVLKQMDPGIYGGGQNSVLDLALYRASSGSLHPNTAMPGPYSRAINSLRRRMGSIIFTFHVRNAVENFGALFGGLSTQFGVPLKYVAPAWQARYADLAYIRKVSPMMDGRLQKGAQQIVAEDFTPAQLREKLSNRIGYLAPRLTQQLLEATMWKAAHDQWMAEMRPDGMSDTQAIEEARIYADRKVRINLGSGDVLDAPGYEGAYGELGRMLTQFTGWFAYKNSMAQVAWARATTEGGLGGYGRFTWNAFCLFYLEFMFGAALAALLKGDDGSDDEDKWEAFAIESMIKVPMRMALAGAIPIAGDMIGGGAEQLLFGSGRGIQAPRTGAFDWMARNASKTLKLLEGEFKGDELRAAVELAAGILGRDALMLPAFAGRQIGYAGRLMSGEETPEGVTDAVRGFIQGK